MKIKSEKKGNIMLRTLLVFTIILLVLIALKFIFFPSAKEISTSGKYEIKSIDYLVNEEKTDPYYQDWRQRQLQVRKWYPVNCNEKNPVVIASHGSAGSIDNNKSLYRELASNGYVVLAVGHPGQASSVKYENGKKNSCQQNIFTRKF